MSIATITWEKRREASATFDDITADVMARPAPFLQQGIRGYGPTDRVASPGKLVFYLNNSASNSQSTLGYYYDGQTDFIKGLPIRITITSGAQTKKYLFYMYKIEPVLGQYGPRIVKVTCYDYMYKQQIGQGPITDTSPAGAAEEAYSLRGGNPENAIYDTNIDMDFPLLYHDIAEESNITSAWQSICESSLAYIYVRPDSTDGETWVYQSRMDRNGQPSYKAFFDDNMTELKFPSNADHTITDIWVDGDYVLEDSAATTELWTLKNEITLAAGETKSFTVNFKNADPSAHVVLGDSVVTSLVASTHYRMSSVSGNSGSDLNASLSASLSVSNWKDEADWTLENTGASTGYVNLLKVIGKGLYVFDKNASFYQYVPGSALFDREYFYRYPYYHSDSMVDEIGRWILDRYNQYTGHIGGQLTFSPTTNSSMMTKWMGTSIGSFIKVNETIKDVDTSTPTDFYIQNERVTFLSGEHIRVTYGLDCCPDESNYLLVDPSGNYILDTSSGANGIYGREWIK